MHRLDSVWLSSLVSITITIQFLFNTAPDDVIGCVSDLGWMAAHSYVVYGPLCNGNTTVLFESTATHPDPGTKRITFLGGQGHSAT